VLRGLLIKGFAIPLGLLVFFALAPAWLDARLHAAYRESVGRSNASDARKSAQYRALDAIDFAAVSRGAAGGRHADLRARLEETGVAGRFQRLSWGRDASIALLAILAASAGATALLSRRARRSPAALIGAYRLSWRMSVASALVATVVLIPLFTYGLYELTTLALNRYFPQLLLFMVVGGCVALVRCAGILLKPVPLEFNEPLARPATAQEAPELWQAVRGAAARLETAPPDHILVGLKTNFYVTELAVKHGSGRSEGRTLYVSLPIMRRLPPEEVLAFIGHELGHFIGADTRVTREFYPLHLKANATVMTLARSGWVGWTSVHQLAFFNWCFGAAERATSRERELKADAVAARLTSPDAAARALVRFHIFTEAIRLGVAGKGAQRIENPMEASLSDILQGSLLRSDAFWNQLFEAHTPHPLDSHPPLNVRLESLGRPMTAAQAKTLAVEPAQSAYAAWLAPREALFAGLAEQANAMVAKIRKRADVVQATYSTDEGRRLLEANFPEVVWHVRPASYIIPSLALAIFGLVGLLVAFEIRDAGARAFWGAAGLVAAAYAVVVWRRHRGGTYVLKADSLDYSGWVRPLLFSNVAAATFARGGYGIFNLVLRLKDPEPPLPRFSVLPLRRRRHTVQLGPIRGDKKQLAATFAKYLQRQVS